MGQFDHLWEQSKGHEYDTGGSDTGYESTTDRSSDIPDVKTGNITSAAIGAGASIAGSILEGAVSSANTEKVGQQAYETAMRQGEMVQQQEDISYRHKMAAFKQEEKGFELQKRRDTFVTNFNSFVKSVEKAEKTKLRRKQLAEGISNKAKTNDNLANIIIQNWGK